MGSNVVDIIYRVDRIALPESKTYILSHEDGSLVRETIGGVTLNHLAWARILGVKTGLFGKQGDDVYGRRIRSVMDRFGIDRSHITADGVASSFSIIFVDPQTNRAIYMARTSTAETTPDYIRKNHADYIKNAKILSTEVSQLPLNCVIEILRIAKSNNVRTVVDIDLPPSYAVNVAKLGTNEELMEILRLADIVKPTREAAGELFPDIQDTLKLAQAIIKKFSDKNPNKICVITDSVNGCAVCCQGKLFRMEACKNIRAVDSTGAGDAFLGGFIAGFVHNLSLEDGARLANAAGAACCEITGAFPVLGSEKRVMELYSSIGGSYQFNLKSEPRKTPAEVACETIKKESDELRRVADMVSPDYLSGAVTLISEQVSKGFRVHVTGVGKPGEIAHKIAATMRSFGIPAYTLHAVNALHGDSGGVIKGDVVIAISNSGNTLELRPAVDKIKENGAFLIAITSSRESYLGRKSDIVLETGPIAEADHLGMAPTSSTTVQMVIGDALSVGAAYALGADKKLFQKYHPGGALGKK